MIDLSDEEIAAIEGDAARAKRWGEQVPVSRAIANAARDKAVKGVLCYLRLLDGGGAYADELESWLKSQGIERTGD